RRLASRMARAAVDHGARCRIHRQPDQLRTAPAGLRIVEREPRPRMEARRAAAAASARRAAEPRQPAAGREVAGLRLCRAGTSNLRQRTTRLLMSGAGTAAGPWRPEPEPTLILATLRRVLLT